MCGISTILPKMCGISFFLDWIISPQKAGVTELFKDSHYFIRARWTDSSTFLFSKRPLSLFFCGKAQKLYYFESSIPQKSSIVFEHCPFFLLKHSFGLPRGYPLDLLPAQSSPLGAKKFFSRGYQFSNRF